MQTVYSGLMYDIRIANWLGGSEPFRCWRDTKYALLLDIRVIRDTIWNMIFAGILVRHTSSPQRSTGDHRVGRDTEVAIQKWRSACDLQRDCPVAFVLGLEHVGHLELLVLFMPVDDRVPPAER